MKQDIQIFRPPFLALGPICINLSRPSICIYQPWLIRIRNKSQRLHIMLPFLFLLSDSFVTLIVDRNETKGNLRKNRLTDKLTSISQVKQKKKQNEINWIKLKKTKIHLKQVYEIKTWSYVGADYMEIFILGWNFKSVYRIDKNCNYMKNFNLGWNMTASGK